MSTFIGKRSARWPSSLVPYSIHPSFNRRPTMEQAMSIIEANTNLRFTRRLSHQKHCIVFRNFGRSGSCNSSAIGRQGGKQFVNCSSASLGTMIHEILHAVGMYHEHQRSDRNNFVRVRPARALEQFRGNFNRKTNTLNSSNYDFRSIMHYQPTTFAIDNSLPPITRLNGSTNGIGSTGTPTNTDWNGVNGAYPDLGIVRRGDSATSSGVVRALEAEYLRLNQAVVGVKTKEHELKLIPYEVRDNNDLIRIRQQSQAKTGKIGVFSLASRPGMRQIVSAVTTKTGRLLLISWSYTQNTNNSVTRIARVSDSAQLAGNTDIVKLVRVRLGIYVTAIRTTDSSKRLKLIAWRVEGNGRITRLGDSAKLAGLTRSIDLQLIRSTASGALLATNIITKENRVKTIVWSVSNNGVFRRLSDSGKQIGKATLVSAVARWNNTRNEGNIVVSFKTTSKGNLKLALLTVQANGRRLRRINAANIEAGKIRLNKLILSANSSVSGTYECLSIVKTKESTLKVIRWNVDPNTRRIERGGDSDNQAGKIKSDLDAVSSNGFSAAGESDLVTFVHSNQSTLKGIVWDTVAQEGALDR